LSPFFDLRSDKEEAICQKRRKIMQHDPQNEPYFAQGAEGTLYPKDHVVGVLDDPQHAEQAVHDLEATGFNSEDIHLDRGEEMLKCTNEACPATWRQRLRQTFRWGTDEAPAIDAYFQEARAGKCIISVHTNNDEQVNQVNEILAAHKGREIKLFGRWSVADLPSSP
jgi:hypothetical protein